jgi:hypothetical protein
VKSRTLHAKIFPASNVGVNTSVQRMRELYEAVGINVQLASTENLSLPDLNDVDVGQCLLGQTSGCAGRPRSVEGGRPAYPRRAPDAHGHRPYATPRTHQHASA